jgi:hypothetical protein
MGCIICKNKDKKAVYIKKMLELDKDNNVTKKVTSVKKDNIYDSKKNIEVLIIESSDSIEFDIIDCYTP